MGFILHKEINIKQNSIADNSVNFFIHGQLIGWTDGDNNIRSEHILKVIKNNWISGGPNSLAKFMRGVVGPCIVEIIDKNNVWFFASCSSSGFYWMNQSVIDKEISKYFVSNDEGNFLRKAFHNSKKISEGSIMNAIFSHQSVIRPPFTSLVSETKRCPPGFYVNFYHNGFKLHSYIINKNNNSRKEQDHNLVKKFDSISFLYKSYFKTQNAISKLAFSGGIDSTVLLINNKANLDKSSQGFYIDRGKISEKKMALEIAKILGCQIYFVRPHEDHLFIKIKEKAEKGLAVFNGIGYLKHGFQFSPYKSKLIKNLFILNGQNSDTMFHIDTFSPSSFTSGINRFIGMSKGIFLRFQTTLLYYSFKKNFKKVLPPGVEKTYFNINEHGTKDISLPNSIQSILKNYKNEKFIKPTINWFETEFYPKLYKSKLSISEKYNHGARLARWLRTISNFHQQFNNISNCEGVTILTPFSEGPIATELLSYRLGLRDVIFPKLFLHELISKRLGKSYSMIRKKALNSEKTYLALKIVNYSRKIMTKIKKIFFQFKKKDLTNNSFKISKQDLFILREILGHKEGVVDRFLISQINNFDCINYLNYLYDCIELKVDPKSLNQSVGTELCRLVNLQIMLLKK